MWAVFGRFWRTSPREWVSSSFHHAAAVEASAAKARVRIIVERGRVSKGDRDSIKNAGDSDRHDENYKLPLLMHH